MERILLLPRGPVFLLVYTKCHSIAPRRRQRCFWKSEKKINVLQNGLPNSVPEPHLFRFELSWSAQIFAVVVSEMVVADDADRFDSGADQKVHQDTFDFGLAGFKVVTYKEVGREFYNRDGKLVK